MLQNFKLYFISFIAIIAIDVVWIGIIMSRFYIEQLRPIGRIEDNKFSPIYWAAAVVYIALSLAIVHFALPKISQDASWLYCFSVGALLGILIYATYDFTNLATLKDWTLKMSIIDMLWGGILGGIVTSITRFVRDW